MSLFSRGKAKAKELALRLKNEHATPREIGHAVALGVFAGCTPALGLHLWIAAALATLFKRSRLWAILGSRVSSVLILPWIVMGEIQAGHYLLHGTRLPLSVKTVFEKRSALLGDWFVGMFPVGISLSVLFGLLAFGGAAAWQRRGRGGKGGALKPRGVDVGVELGPRLGGASSSGHAERDEHGGAAEEAK